MGRLQDRICVITGGGGGIGAATAARMIRDGARVVLADIDIDRAQAVAAELGEAAEAAALDQSDEASVRALVDGVIARHGRIDVLHNNAALTTPSVIAADLDVISTGIEIWDAAYATNLRGYVLCSKYVLPHMIARQSGVIVNMSSFAGLAGDIARTAYGCMKAAIILLTESIATAHGKQGIRCVGVAPGAVLSDNMRQHVDQALMSLILRHHSTPQAGVPDDVANLVAFLASDDARYITGITVPIDGGLSTRSPMVADALAMG